MDLSKLKDNYGREVEKLEYAMVSGIVKPESIDLHSLNGQDQGVLRTIEITKYITQEIKWSQKNCDTVQFNIVSNNQDKLQFKINIERPLMASYLFDNLKETFDRTVFYNTKIFDSAFGHRITEKMLKNDTSIIALGHLEKIDAIDGLHGIHSYCLKENDCEEFIVTSLTQTELIQRIKNTTGILKFSMFISTVIGGYFFYKYLFKRKKTTKTNLLKERYMDDISFNFNYESHNDTFLIPSGNDYFYEPPTILRQNIHNGLKQNLKKRKRKKKTLKTN